MARWNSCNILQLAPNGQWLWQFDAKGNNFVLNREQRVAINENLPGKIVAKSWGSLLQPKLNVAWLPPENVFLRVVELPASNFAETQSMVELQLEKLSPLPVAQIVWTLHVLPQPATRASETQMENLQTVVVIIAERRAVEDFLGKLEAQKFLADRLEVPFLDRLEAISPTEDGAWIFPIASGLQETALVAWWFGGVLRNLSFVTLAPGGDQASELKNQFKLLVWAGELEGWLTAQPHWHLVVEPERAAVWENVLRAALDEPLQIVAPPTATELASRTARRAANTNVNAQANLLPADFSTRYRQQLQDRLWLHGLGYVGATYLVFLVIYFCATNILGYHTQKVESQVAAISNDYTNALQLKAQYNVLKERQELKYAALDVWKLIAQELPPGISLQRLSFADGKNISISGVCAPNQIGLISDPNQFYDRVRKMKVNGQPMFNPEISSSEQLAYRQVNNNITWSFGLELQHTEEQTQ
jgi:hypothetical protein